MSKMKRKIDILEIDLKQINCFLDSSKLIIVRKMYYKASLYGAFFYENER